MEEMRDDDGRHTLPRDASSGGDHGASQDEAGDNDGETVRRRAYERFISRGDGPGSDVDDWLEAERDVRGERENDRR